MCVFPQPASGVSMSDQSETTRYRDLTFQKARVYNTSKEFQRVHMGSRAPSNDELKALTKEFANSAQDLRLLYVGMTGIDGVPADPSAENNNAIMLLFPNQSSLRKFLDQPISSSMKDVSIVLDVTRPPRL
jgi:hypothetical protein